MISRKQNKEIVALLSPPQINGCKIIDKIKLVIIHTCSCRSEILFEFDESMFVDVGCFSVGFGENERVV